jgi:hypothetical protein
MNVHNAGPSCGFVVHGTRLCGGHRDLAPLLGRLVGLGEAKDEPPPDEGGRSKSLRLALDWLKADVAACNPDA